MGSTLIQYVTPGIAGKLLFESFESQDWPSDESWNVLNGNPQASTVQAFDGLRSFGMDLTYPLIQNLLSKPTKWAVAYFYDDMTTANPSCSPFWMFKSGASLLSGIGVDNSISTVNYCSIIDGVKVAHPVSRSLGWHRFTFRVIGAGIQLGIDGALQSPSVASTVFQELQVGCTDTSGPAFGFFDNLQVSLDIMLKLFGLKDGDFAQLFNANNGTPGPIIAAQLAVAGEADFSVPFTDAPFLGYIRIRPGLQSRRFKYLGEVRQFFTGDYLRYRELDLERRPATFMLQPTENLEDKESNAGKNEAVFFSAREKGTVTFTDLLETKKQELLPWWSWVKVRNVWSMSLDRDKAGYGFLTQPASSGDDHVTVEDPAGFAPGAQLMLSTVDNVFQEILEVDSVLGNSVFFTAPDGILGNYQKGDYLRARYFWPFLLTEDKSLATKLSPVKVNRWSFEPSFKENL